MCRLAPYSDTGRGPGGAASVILRNKATKNPKPLRDCCVCILTNETHRLYMESESPGSIDLSAGWSGGSGFFTAFRMTGGRAASVILRSKATKNPKPLREYYVYILTNETHGLYIEPESRGSIDPERWVV